jgi:hypothetical protein
MDSRTDGWMDGWTDRYLLQLSTHRCNLTGGLIRGCAVGTSRAITFCQKKNGKSLIQGKGHPITGHEGPEGE